MVLAAMSFRRTSSASLLLDYLASVLEEMLFQQLLYKGAAPTNSCSAYFSHYQHVNHAIGFAHWQRAELAQRSAQILSEYPQLERFRCTKCELNGIHFALLGRLQRQPLMMK